MLTAVELESEVAIGFMEGLKNPEGTDFAGLPLVLTEWEKDHVRKLLDTKRDDGGYQYEESLVFLPKKQGKTTYIAALALYFMTHRSHGQIKCLAQVKDQAALCYKFVCSMIRQDDWLSDRSVCRIYRGKKSIECYVSGTTLDVLSSDAVGANGLNGSVVIYDEVCFSPTSDLYDAVISGGIMRKDFLLIGLSTAGESTAHWGHTYYEKAKAIAANPETAPTFLPLIFEAPDNPDWENVQTYLDCSPTFREMKLEDAIRRIKAMIASAKKNPSELRRILRYHLNKWVGKDSAVPWLALKTWDECPEGDPELLTGRQCWGGLDLASVSDLTALGFIFPLDEGKYAAIMRFYMPSDTLADKERTDAGAQYTAWARAGLITVTPGDWTDYDFILQDIIKLQKKYQIMGIAVDRAHNAAHICQQMIKEGVNVQPIGQGTFTVCPAAKEIERLVTSRKLLHYRNALLRWNVQNCVAKIVDDVGNVRPSKAKSTGRIDGIYALINAMAIEMAGRSEEGAGEPGVFFF